jgi:hypothetical protein
MAKLASVRVTRAYGPEQMKYQFELANAVAYLVATALGVVGVVFFLPGWKAPVGLWCLLVALLLIVCVNVHDLYAQLAGFDFRLPLVTLDPQLALIEIAAPLVQAIGGLLFLIGFILFLRVSLGLHLGIQLFGFNSMLCLAVVELIERQSDRRSKALRISVEGNFRSNVHPLPFLDYLEIFFYEAQITQGTFDSIDVAKVTDHAYSLLIAGSAFWLLGSIHNAFQVYENTDTRVQFMQKTVSVPLLIANTLFLVATILSFETWNLPPVAVKAAVAPSTSTPCPLM